MAAADRASHQNVSRRDTSMTNSEHAFLSLPAYWDGIAEALSARLSAAKKYLRHPVAGFSAEGYYIDLLREYVPKRYAVETGFVINAAGNRSQHLDIIVADTFHIPPLCSEPTYRVFAAESVCAVIEVTTSPRGRDKGIGKLEQDIGKLAQVRTLCKEREYFEFSQSWSERRLSTAQFRLRLPSALAATSSRPATNGSLLTHTQRTLSSLSNG